jgi:hypothetical protein
MGDSASFEAPGLKQQMGIGDGEQRLVGVADVQTGPVSTVGAGLQVLLTSVLKANSLSENGKGIRITAWGTATGVAGDKSAIITFGGSNIGQAVIAVAVALNSWHMEAVIVRSGPLSQEGSGIGLIGLSPSVATPVNQLSAAFAKNPALDIPITVTGLCLNAADTLIARGMVVEFLN